MPYGPGAFEGEPFSTFLLNEWSLISGQSENCSDDSGEWAALFRGPFERDEITVEHIVHGYDAGYTEVEMAESVEALLSAKAAIFTTNSVGFYSGRLYDDASEAEDDYNRIAEDLTR